MGTHPALVTIRQRLRRWEKILKKSDYQRVFQEGKRKRARWFMLVCKQRSDDGPSRIGIVAGKRVGGAVERNRLKRWIRELFRIQKSNIKPGFDIVMVLHREAQEMSRSSLMQDWEYMMTDLGVSL